MDSRYISETWFFYGACDLYFSFYTEDWTFDYHSAFSAIMALEKHFKGFLLFHRSSEYDQLSDDDAKAKIQSIAREYGHNFEKMATSCGRFLESTELDQLLDQDYDGYSGRDLLQVLRRAYMETRYPTDIPVSLSFPLDEPDTYHDPLGSSGFHHFVFRICEFLLLSLAPKIDVAKILRNLIGQYEHQEAIGRFKNLFAKDSWP